MVMRIVIKTVSRQLARSGEIEPDENTVSEKLALLYTAWLILVNLLDGVLTVIALRYPEVFSEANPLFTSTDWIITIKCIGMIAIVYLAKWLNKWNLVLYIDIGLTFVVLWNIIMIGTRTAVGVA